KRRRRALLDVISKRKIKAKKKIRAHPPHPVGPPAHRSSRGPPGFQAKGPLAPLPANAKEVQITRRIIALEPVSVQKAPILRTTTKLDAIAVTTTHPLDFVHNYKTTPLSPVKAFSPCSLVRQQCTRRTKK
ncbi:hypothetical protein E4T56_gene5812, partial [Termitomyces sp. T112]